MPDSSRRPASLQLRETAEQEQIAELAKNEFRENSSEYGVTKVPEEIDGALEERTKLTVMNMYNENGEYRNPDNEGA